MRLVWFQKETEDLSFLYEIKKLSRLDISLSSRLRPFKRLLKIQGIEYCVSVLDLGLYWQELHLQVPARIIISIVCLYESKLVILNEN